jgi:Holliday junction resolvase RusA-like endonuclease
MTFKLMGQLPSGKNRIIVTRTGHRFPDPKSRFPKWRDDVMKQITAQLKPDWSGFTERCKMIVDYTPSDLRTRDVPGMLDALCHVLAKAGIVKDDGLIRDVEWHEFPIDREHPMAVVTIRRLN